MPLTRQSTLLPKRNVRNGALLAVSEASKLVNIPLAQDVATHLKQIAVALKAPKTNDTSAKDLSKHVQGLLDVLNRAIQYLDGLGLFGDHVDILVELSQLQAELSSTYAELQRMQNAQYTTKLASQAEIRGRILELKEQLSRTIGDLTLRLLVIVLASSTQSQQVMARRLDSTNRKYITLARRHKALAYDHTVAVRTQQRTRRHQLISDRRIRNLTQEVHAVRLMQKTDEQRISLLILLNDHEGKISAL